MSNYIDVLVILVSIITVLALLFVLGYCRHLENQLDLQDLRIDKCANDMYDLRRRLNSANVIPYWSEDDE